MKCIRKPEINSFGRFLDSEMTIETYAQNSSTLSPQSTHSLNTLALNDSLQVYNFEISQPQSPLVDER